MGVKKTMRKTNAFFHLIPIYVKTTLTEYLLVVHYKFKNIITTIDLKAERERFIQNSIIL